MLLPGADELVCHAVAKRIQEALAAHPGRGGFSLAASVGYGTTPPAATVADALRIADERMYQTKQREKRPGENSSAA